MLAVTNYKRDFVQACRDRVERQLSAYDALTGAAKPAHVATFAPEFFNTAVLALDHYFMHRVRAQELKDGNPLNEVRMLAVSLLEHEGVMTKDNTIRYAPEKSVTGIAIGEKIAIDRLTFERLADAFFADIDKKYP